MTQAPASPGDHYTPLADASLDRLFREARSYNAWAPQGVPAALIREIYDLAKWGPTATNSGPARFIFLETAQARERLAPLMSVANRPKVLTAPIVAIVAYDLAFAHHLPRLFPHNPLAKDWFSDPALVQETAFRNGSLQGAYLMMAARALGLDCGPMSGFDRAGVDAEFMPASSWRTNFICSLGYGSNERLFARLPRLDFSEACQIL